MKFLALLSLVSLAGLLGMAMPGPAQAACTRIARVDVECSLNGSILTVAVDAKGQRCGRPDALPVPTADQLQINVDQRVGGWVNIPVVQARIGSAALPNFVDIELCAGSVPVFSPDATALRARAALTMFINPENPTGFFFGSCGRFAPPVC